MGPDLTEEEIIRISTGIKEKYAQVAVTGAGGCFKYPTGREGLQQLGYPLDLVQDFPEALLASFCGVGNPFSLGPIYPGENVLDIGCGAGVDSLVAARMVGPRGRVVGIDATEAMITQARAYLAQVGLDNVEFRVAPAETLPFPNDTFNVVLSNGVLNLTLDKEKALAEAHRVLKPGGRLMVADMVLVAALPEGQAERVANWYQ